MTLGETADPMLVHGGDSTHARADHLMLSWRDLGTSPAQ
jgi:hypothetical protein